jgi:hypothetical protein
MNITICPECKQIETPQAPIALYRFDNGERRIMCCYCANLYWGKLRNKNYDIRGIEISMKSEDIEGDFDEKKILKNAEELEESGIFNKIIEDAYKR